MSKDFAEWIFKGAITILLTMALSILKDFDESLDKMQSSVNRLNISFASMAQKLVNQNETNRRLERRLDKLEDKIK